MKKLWVLFVFVGLAACASKPEIPAPAEKIETKKSEPLVDDQTMNELRRTTPWQKAVARRIASRVRKVQQDCQIYAQPTSMSHRVSTVEEGRDVWTQDTDSAWFKVYKDKSYGYVSKICF